MCILLVEDEYLIRLILAEELTEAGFVVREAESGEQAAALIASKADIFTALVTDIHMPGSLDGMAVARLLRERRPGIPVVYMTGRPDVVVAAGATESETSLLPKPFAPSQLLSLVYRLLGGAPSGAGASGRS